MLQAMTISRESHLPAILNEWARWYEESLTAAYPGETTIYRLMKGERGDGNKGWREPRGVHKITPRGAVRRAHEAIQILMDDDDCKPMVSVTRAYYLGGMQAAMDASGKSRAATHYVMKAGEAMIAREMKLRT